MAVRLPKHGFFLLVCVVIVLLAGARPTAARLSKTPQQQIMWPTPTHTRSSTPMVVPLPNLLMNPSFEQDVNQDGKPDFWSYDPANANYIFRTGDRWHSPSFAMKLLTKPALGPYSVWQLVPNIQAGRKYLLETRTVLPATPAQGVRYMIHLVWQNSAGVTVGTPHSWRPTTVGTWVQQGGVVIAPAVRAGCCCAWT